MLQQGFGTATFYEPSSRRFASLGHGIVDPDTEELVEIASRRNCKCKHFVCCKRNRGESAEKFKELLMESRQLEELTKIQDMVYMEIWKI